MNAQTARMLCGAALLLLTGCLSAPEHSSGPGMVTIANTNPRAIFEAAESVFTAQGFSRTTAHFPHSVTFEQRASQAAKMSRGFDARASSYRVVLTAVRIPGTHDFRLIPVASRMDEFNARDTGRRNRMMTVWSVRFQILMDRTRALAANRGQGQ